MSIKIFIVDDHYMVIEGIHSLLQDEKSIEFMGHATNAESCMAFLQQQHPDIILLDINLPDKSGIELCKEIRENYPSVFIVGLSTYNQKSFIEKMMDNGASGYVLKNATREELMEAITTVYSGKLYLSFEAGQTLRKITNNSVILTRRETEILELIAQGMTNNEIAARLFVSSTTVDTHRKNLLAKFGVKNTASLIRAAVQMQLIE
jgi:DNA-binding NarL/FixJ family response regulator